MKKFPLLLLAMLVLAACAPAPAKETSDVSQTSEVLPTPTKTPTPSIIETPRPTATATEKSPKITDSLPNGSYSYDAGGLHIPVAPGQEIVIPTDQIKDRVRVGAFGNLQIFDTETNSVTWAYDEKNKTWIESSTVIQPDGSNPDNYIRISSFDDLPELARKEKLFLTPFPPDTYFPPLDKIVSDYSKKTEANSSQEAWDSGYSFWTPFGILDDLSKSPFRPVNYILLPKNEGVLMDVFITTEQIFNVDDGTSSLLHCGFDGFDKKYFADYFAEHKFFKEGKYLLPSYMMDEKYIITRQSAMIENLKRKDYMKSDGTTPKIMAWIMEWVASGHFPKPLEDIPVWCNVKNFKKE